jgi:dTDP-4-amino-4,6-dideoxygalactose transaminase
MLPKVKDLLPYLLRIEEARIYSNFGTLSVELERRLAAKLDVAVESVICTNSGTSAIIAAILATTGPASQKRLAACPAFTFVATAVAAERCGYKPLFVDVEPETWQLSPQALEKHPRLNEIGLVIPVAPFGRPVRLEPWLEFQSRTGVQVVIDCAASFACISESLERWFGEIPVAMSFHATKSFATGEGGAVVWKHPEAKKRLTQAINFGFFGTRESFASSINGKMSEYHAAVGLAELDGWHNKFTSLKLRGEWYRSLLKRPQNGYFIGYPDVDLNYPLYCCKTLENRLLIQEAFTKEGVGFRFWYGDGLHRHGFYRDAPCGDVSCSEDLATRLIGLPMAPDLTFANIARICNILLDASGEEIERVE